MNFTAGAGATGIGGNTLTIFGTASNGNTAGNGITVATGSGAHTIASGVVVGSDQTWTNGSGNALTVSATIGGGAALGFERCVCVFWQHSQHAVRDADAGFRNAYALQTGRGGRVGWW